MAKKVKPSLKDYLKTGKRVTADPVPEQVTQQPPVRNDAFLDLLAPSDLKMWEAIVATGTAVELLPFDITSLREDFQTMDKARFTCYILPKKGETLRPVRSGSQIQPPLELLLKWDETGVLTVYDPDA